MKGKVYRKASKFLVLIKGMFNHETLIAESFNRSMRRMSGRDGEVNTGGIRDPSPNKPTWFPLKKPKTEIKPKQKKQGTSASPLETKRGCCTPVWNTWNFCVPLSWHIRSTGHAGLRNSHQARETPQPWEAGMHRGHILYPLSYPKGSGKLSCPARPHREEKPRVDLIPAYTVETPMWGKGQPGPLKTERKMW